MTILYCTCLFIHRDESDQVRIVHTHSLTHNKKFTCYLPSYQLDTRLQNTRDLKKNLKKITNKKIKSNIN